MNLGGLIPFLGGIYCSLLGFGVIAPGKNPEFNELWLRKFGTFTKIVGPFLIVFGLLQMFVLK